MNTKIIKLDINNKMYETITAKQGDTESRFLLFHLFDASLPFDLTEKSVRVYGIKPDGTKIFNDLVINDVKKGYCTLKLTNQMLAIAGLVKLELVIYSGNKKLSSIPFMLNVISSLNSDDAVVSTNEFTSLMNGLAALSEYDIYKSNAKQVPGIKEEVSNLSSQLDTCAKKDEIFSMANMGQDIKEAMTNGSVAVVGNNMILKENIVPNQINYDKTDFINTGKNLLNLKNIKYNCYIDNKGQLINNSNYITTDYIQFRKGEKINLSRKTDDGNISLRGIRFACFFNSNYEAISNLYYDNLSNIESLICNNEDVFCVKLTFLKGYADKNSMLYKGEEVNYIEEFHYLINELKANHKIVEEINNIVSNIDVKKFIEDKEVINNANIIPFSLETNSVNFLKLTGNLLVLDKCLEGFYIGDNGIYYNSNTYVTTDFIQIKRGQFITLSRSNNGVITKRAIRTACFYDKDFNFIEFYDNPSSNNESLKCNSEGVCYVKLSILKGYYDTLTNLTYGNQVPSQVEKNKIELKNSNILNGKHIVGFGDSIVYGAGNSGYGIVDIIAENNDMTCENKAVGGATILKRTSNNIPKQIENYEGNPDYIILDGYINDCVLSDVLEVLGDVSPYYGGNFDNSTIIGQFETMLKYMLTKFHSSKIVYICVHHMSSRDDSKVKIVHDKIVKACKKWSIPFVDLYEEGQLNTTINIHKEKYTDSGDSTHPNRLGYDLFYIPKIEAKLKTL